MRAQFSHTTYHSLSNEVISIALNCIYFYGRKRTSLVTIIHQVNDARVFLQETICNILNETKYTTHFVKYLLVSI